MIRLVLAILYLVACIQGLIMTFKASIVLGICGFFFGLPFAAEAVVWWFTKYDIALHIAKAFGLP